MVIPSHPWGAGPQLTPELTTVGHFGEPSSMNHGSTAAGSPGFHGWVPQEQQYCCGCCCCCQCRAQSTDQPAGYHYPPPVDYSRLPQGPNPSFFYPAAFAPVDVSFGKYHLTADSTRVQNGIHISSMTDNGPVSNAVMHGSRATEIGDYMRSVSNQGSGRDGAWILVQCIPNSVRELELHEVLRDIAFVKNLVYFESGVVGTGSMNHSYIQ